MATYLLKKSYQLKDLKQIEFQCPKFNEMTELVDSHLEAIHTTIEFTRPTRKIIETNKNKLGHIAN